MELVELLAESARLREHTHADTTLKAYAFDWQQFVAWCDNRSSLPATPETVVLYLTDSIVKGKKLPTLCRRAAAINYYHRREGFPPPADVEVRSLLGGARRLTQHQPKQKTALTVEHLRAACRKSWEGTKPKAVRNHAILTFGFASALRRSNLVSLMLHDLRFVREGLIVHVRREKNDQEGKGRYIGIARGEHLETCAVGAMKRWLEIRGYESGPLFVPLRGPFTHLDAEIVAQVVKAAVQAIGLQPGSYAGHSLRSGFVTSAIENGAGELVVARQTGHRSLDSLRRYFRSTDLFRANASAMIGL